MAMRGLTVFISDLRNCTNPEQEKKRVEKEMAHIRSKFTSDANMNGYNKKKYVWKILYMYMLGYEVDFGHMEAVALLSSPKYSEKSVGYAWCALMLREGDELLRLIINSIRSDLISKQDNAICLALNAICNVGGKEFAETLATDVLKLLTANMTKTYVRKKAALTTLRLYRKAPDMLPASEWADKILMLLDEKNIGVLTSVSSLVLGILAIDTVGWDNCAPKVCCRPLEVATGGVGVMARAAAVIVGSRTAQATRATLPARRDAPGGRSTPRARLAHALGLSAP